MGFSDKNILNESTRDNFLIPYVNMLKEKGIETNLGELKAVTSILPVLRDIISMETSLKIRNLVYSLISLTNSRKRYAKGLMPLY